MKTSNWTQEEKDFLIRSYATHDTQEIADALDRSRSSVRAKASRMNLKKEFAGVAISEGKKQCTQCKRILEITEFASSTTHKNGYASACNFCNSDRQKKIRKIEQLKTKTGGERYICSHCGTERIGWDFKWNSNKMRRERACIKCCSERNRINKINRIKEGRDW